MRYGSDYLKPIFDGNILRCIIYPKRSNLNPNSRLDMNRSDIYIMDILTHP